MEKKINSILIIVTSLFLALLPFFTKVVYQTNDDNIYIYMLSGVFNGECSPITIYEGFLQGLLISNLYRIGNVVEWYTLYLMLASLLAYITISFIVLFSKYNKMIKYVIFTAIFAIQLYFHAQPQFTIIASELAVASFLVYLYGEKKWHYVFSILLFALAFEMRYDATVLVFVLLSPILIVLGKLNEGKRKRTVVELLVFCIVTLLLWGIDRYSIQNSKFASYYEYNEPRNYLGCNPGYFYGKSELNDIESLELDQMYGIWVFDSKILTKDALERCAAEVKKHWKDIIFINFKEYFDLYFRVGLFFLLLLFIPIIFLDFRNKDWISILSVFLLLAIFIAVNIYMMSYSFPKTRNIIPVFLAMLVYGTISLTRYKEKLAIVLTLFLYSICIVLYLHKADYVAGCWNKEHLSKVEEVSDILNKVPDDKVLFSSLVPFQTEIYKSSKSEISKKIVLSDWITNSPYSIPYYTGYESLVEGLPFLINKDEMDYVDNIVKQIHNVYQIQVIKEVALESDNFYFVRIRQK